MKYFSFFRNYSRLLAFAVLLAFFSSFGQTFLISFYVPEFAGAFDLTEGRIGVLYGIATVGSALLLPWTGRLIDRVSLSRYTLAVSAGLGLGGLILAVAPHWILLFAGLLIVRHCGQGLCGHIAMTSSGRYFVENRGKAVAIAGTGYPLGEILFPALITLSIAVLGWRLSWGLSAGLIIVVLAPLALSLLRSSRRLENALPKVDSGTSDESRNWRASLLLTDYRFYVILATLVPIGFFSTAFIFYQAVIAESRDWGDHVFPSAFAAFAITRAMLALAIGPWIDRLTAVRLLPAHMILLLIAGAFLVFFSGEWAAYAYLICLGMSMGVGQSVATAVWAEVYGVENLGGIRSVASMIGVLSTALAPLIFGMLLDFNIEVPTLLRGALVMILALTLFSFVAASILNRARLTKQG